MLSISRRLILVVFTLLATVTTRVSTNAQEQEDFDFLNSMALPWRCGDIEAHGANPQNWVSNSAWDAHWNDPDGNRSPDGVSIDLNGTLNERGHEVIAPIAGTAVYEDSWPYGKHITIDTGSGWSVILAHFLNPYPITRQSGSIFSVMKGELIGYVDNTGYSEGDHLHLELRWNGGLPSTSWFDDNSHFMLGYPLSEFKDPNTRFYSNNCSSDQYTTVLYEHTDMSGRVYKLYGLGSFSIPAWFDNQASYVVSDAPAVILYNQINQLGSSVGLDGTNQPISQSLVPLSYSNASGSVNDTVSSVMVLNACTQAGGVQSASINDCIPPTPNPTSTPPPGSTATPVATPTATPIPPGIRLCDGANYGDPCQSFAEGEYPDLDQYGVADWVESVKFDDAYEFNTDVWLYREDNFAGETIHTTGNLGSLGNLANHVRSMKIDRREETTSYCTDYPDGVTLFSDVNFAGSASPAFTTNHTNLGNIGWSDRAYSVKLCGYCVRLWRDADFQGIHTEECSGGSDINLSDDAVGGASVTSLEVWPNPYATPEIPTPTPTVTPVPTSTPSPTPTPNPGSIYFASYRFGTTTYIYKVNPDGSGLTDLSAGGPPRVGDPYVSPDGGKIAYTSWTDGQPIRLWIMNSNGSGKTQITSMGIRGNSITWSPDSSTILFMNDTDTAVYTIHPDGTSLTQLTNWPSGLYPTDWSPDGTKILAHGSAGTYWGIWETDSDGSNPVALSNGQVSEVAPKYSPDGTKIVYNSNASGQNEIWIMNRDTSGKVKLTTTPNTGSTEGSHAIYPRFAPDGARILFASNRDNSTGYWDIYVMNIDGSNIVNITNHAGTEQWATWGASSP